jgi:hypothetical protein
MTCVNMVQVEFNEINYSYYYYILFKYLNKYK